MSALAWYWAQLLPLRYQSVYKQDDRWHHVHWRMWLGRSFSIDDVELT